MITFIYVDGVKKYLDQPRQPAGDSPMIRYGHWTKVRLRNEPGGLVVSEHTVPGDLFNPKMNGRWRTGGHTYSRLPDTSFSPSSAS